MTEFISKFKPFFYFIQTSSYLAFIFLTTERCLGVKSAYPFIG